MSTVEHPHALAHHFDDLEQQKDSLTLGMWIFLVTEIMIFGGLFTGYTVYRSMYPVAFAEASGHLNLVLASINTVVLIGSSLTMALAVYGAQIGNRKMLVACLGLTVLLGTAFLGIKAKEYWDDYTEHLMPIPRMLEKVQWKYWEKANIPAVDYLYGSSTFSNDQLSQSQIDDLKRQEYLRRVQMFLTLYYIMTGLHATHMIAGMAILLFMMWKAHRNAYTPEYHPQVEMIGLYWHFVDIVWIFLLPLLYLIGAHSH